MTKKDSSFLNYIILIPFFSTLLFLLFTVAAYTYLNVKDGDIFVKNIESKMIADKKNMIKDRVSFVVDCIKSKQRDLKKKIAKGSYTKEEIQKLTKETKDGIIETINSFLFGDNGYIFIYKILNFNGGKRFAIMVANPNRPTLIGKYIDSDYKDAKGFMFRREFLKKIKKDGEAFIIYYYKKPNSTKISPKISYFKLNKEWNWVVASGVYLDDIYASSAKQRELIFSNIKKNNLIIICVAIIVLILSILSSFMLYKLIKREFAAYNRFIERQRRALFVSNRILKQQLYRDHLTKLKNRKILLQNLEKKNFYALVIIDIDDFKIINELYGNKLGNKVLLQLTKILVDFSKRNDCLSTVYRLGSDEFVLLVGGKRDFNFFQNMMKSLYEHILSSNFQLIENIKINIEVTMGISLSKKDALSKADIALNYAKKNRKIFAIYSQSIDNRVDIDKNIKIKKELLDAVKEDRVVPFFQPICDKYGDIVKYEALVRVLLNDRKGVLTPGYFLQIAKKLKLYPTLSKTMLKKSFEKFKDNDKMFSVNLSLNDIVNIETVQFIEDIIKEHPKTAKRLIFEILESEGIEDFDVTKNFIEKVRRMGVKIAIDDFGSGYSSFKYILEIKPDYIKIDGSLISEIASNKNSFVMVKNIINMAKDLDIVTVAEFVSSKEIYEILKDLNVDEYQGYYIGRPKKDLIGERVEESNLPS